MANRLAACHARKVRCDAASLGVPCTNCIAFSVECRIQAPKRKKTRAKNAYSSKPGEDKGALVSTSTEPQDKVIVYDQEHGTPSTTVSSVYTAHQATDNSTYMRFLRPKLARAPIKEVSPVANLRDPANLSVLVHDRHKITNVVHHPLPHDVRGAKPLRTNEMDDMEIRILHQRGAFLLPPRELCDELLEAFFKWVAPIVPVINRNSFMRQYRDPNNPLSLLLLQAVLLAGTRVCTSPQLMDANGSTTPAAMCFYKRAKALYDANFENDRVTIVQSLILMGWYWEGPEHVTKNVLYWTRVAIIVAQGSGMHRSVERSQLSQSHKRLWKRIWWTLFTRDHSVAIALGRPVAIDPADFDVEMISEDDFMEDEADRPAEHPPDPVHVQFFINYVKLSEIMGLVLSQQYSVASNYRRANALDLTHGDVALADWLQHCSLEVQWDRSRHHFWAALLNLNYYTTLCLLHRAHMPPTGSPLSNNLDGFGEVHAYPSRNIAHEAAAMMTSIIENFQAHNEIQYTPAFVVYSLFLALIMHLSQLKSSNKSIVSATEKRIQICMDALKVVSEVWPVARMVYTLFESILENKHPEGRVQKAASKYQKKKKASTGPPQPLMPIQEPPLKRKLDDIDVDCLPTTKDPPPSQVSYEGSIPQRCTISPLREVTPQQQQMPQMTTGSPYMSRQNQDAFMGPSRSGTRPTTPFNPSYSYPESPSDLFLVTRKTPNISPELWQNFQSDQLFPADTEFSFLETLPAQSDQQHHAQGDAWSDSSNGQHNPTLPISSNVGDWFNFFSIKGEAEMSHMFQRGLS